MPAVATPGTAPARVAVLDGLDKLAPPTESEQALASARHFPSTIRLACQARPRPTAHQGPAADPR